MSKPVRLRGIIPPVITPLDADGEVHVSSLRRLIEFQVTAGVDALWILGSTGEFYGLDERQRDVVTGVAIETAAGRVPVVVGCADTGTRRSIEAARKALAAGADAIFVTAPIYLPVSQDEVAAQCRAIRDAIDLPLYLYNAQFATQTPIENATVLGLAADHSLAGLKDSAGDWSAFRQLTVDLAGDTEFDLLTGNEHMVDAALLMGAVGGVASTANVIPEIYVALYRAAQAGDWVEAARQQNLATAISRYVKCGPSNGTFISRFFSGTKAALKLRGIVSETAASAPLLQGSVDDHGAVRRILAEFKLLADEAEVAS